ncbi:2,4-dienoyl-CoA reductase-like NADH-dependent reductase (Old Yellow Enzyme family) [Rhizobium leguminosarum]|nr:2,4-dienoyl-CoA reductase-like NADH-dependent reductase (Old Yellow Enzyme family) [Rhizobium leguminosarum]
MASSTLFEPAVLGSLTLSNRIVMAPLTRNRAGAGFVPGDLIAEYYAQRASAGLIISEATQISQQGQGYQDTPGIYTEAQIDGWRKVTDAVHAKAAISSCNSGTSVGYRMSTCSRMGSPPWRLPPSGPKPRRL